jgi:hypothetical protein
LIASAQNGRQQQVLIFGGLAALEVHAYRFNSFRSPGISADKVQISPQRLSGHLHKYNDVFLAQLNQ